MKEGERKRASPLTKCKSGPTGATSCFLAWRHAGARRRSRGGWWTMLLALSRNRVSILFSLPSVRSLSSHIFFSFFSSIASVYRTRIHADTRSLTNLCVTDLSGALDVFLSPDHDRVYLLLLFSNATYQPSFNIFQTNNSSTCVYTWILHLQAFKFPPRFSYISSILIQAE